MKKNSFFFTKGIKKIQLTCEKDKGRKQKDHLIFGHLFFAYIIPPIRLKGVSTPTSFF
jgi:hypothetical protein